MRILTGIAIAFLLTTMGVSLLHLSAGMDMTGGMTHCPFMTHEEVLCPMDLADHIAAWKSAFLAVTPTVMVLLSAAALVVFFAPHVFVATRRPPILLHRQLRERTYTFVYRPLQELFSNGILHPKVF